MMNRRIHAQEKNIVEFTTLLAENRILIPSFQREFVWDRDDIIKLWESIYRFYPIGSILCWETDIRLNIHRKIGGFIFENNGVSPRDNARWVYILDGQQRATALLMPLLGGEGKVKAESDFDYSLYFDAVTENFFFAHELNRRKRKVNPAFLIPLSQMIHDGNQILERVLPEPGRTPMIENHIKQLAHVFSNYNLSLIHMEGFDIPAVREIFERINREGKALSSMDIMIARTFRNYECLVEEDF